MSDIKLTGMQEMFCREYIIDLNATQAAIRAGYSAKTAREQASRMLSNININNRIAELMKERKKRVNITADDVLINLYKMATLDISDIINDDGSIKPVSEWSEDWRRSVGGIDVSEQNIGGETLTSIIKKIKGVDKLKAWELLGKHVDVQAFKEKVGVEGSISANITISKKETHNDTFASIEDEVE